LRHSLGLSDRFGYARLTLANQRVSWILEFRPSLLNMCVTCVSTVRSERKSLVAIAWLLMSSAIRRAISNSLPAPSSVELVCYRSDEKANGLVASALNHAEFDTLIKQLEP
jgi:hypothetical protein